MLEAKIERIAILALPKLTLDGNALQIILLTLRLSLLQLFMVFVSFSSRAA